MTQLYNNTLTLHLNHKYRVREQSYLIELKKKLRQDS